MKTYSLAYLYLIFEYQRHNHKGIYTRESFTYDEANDIYLCPEGKEMRYWGIHKYPEKDLTGKPLQQNSYMLRLL